MRTRSPASPPSADAERGGAGDAYRFYRRPLTADLEPAVSPVPEATVAEWRPSWTRVPPTDLHAPIQWVWWLFHNLRVFRSRAFRVIMLTSGDTLLHRSTVFPPFFRFPFMARGDVQIGDTWTHVDMRGRGLAGLGIRAALRAAGRTGGHAWYVVEDDNHASIRAVEKEGFELVGTGTRRPRLGVRLLGFYSITDHPARAGRATPASTSHSFALADPCIHS